MFVVLVLMLAVVLALGMTFFATQNPERVNVVLAGFSWEQVPLYLIVLASLLLGLLIAWLFGLMSSISSSITMFGKDIKIKRTKETVAELARKVENLEQENRKLRKEVPSKLFQIKPQI